jgi:hypothetical protein
MHVSQLGVWVVELLLVVCTSQLDDLSVRLSAGGSMPSSIGVETDPTPATFKPATSPLDPDSDRR